MTELQAETEILALVANTNDCVDISDIISNYSDGQEFVIQKAVRNTLTSMLFKLEQNGEIVFCDSGYVQRLGQTNPDGSWKFNGTLIRRNKRLSEKKEEDKLAPTYNTMNVGTNYGSIHQSLNDLSKPAIQNTNNNNDAKPPKRSWLEILSWIIGIAIGAIGIYEFIIKK
ncbi:MAG: hypothetical protein QM802_02345 [Agriterribacter sp.]